MKEKGIEYAIDGVKRINEIAGRIVYRLDIYGQIDDNQQQWFRKIEESLPDYIKYCGVIPFNESTSILKEYFALLFPTFYSGEGFAGTLIDAMAAGIPVIASDWKYNSEIVKEGRNGCLFKIEQKDDFIDKLMEMYELSFVWNKRKPDILKEAHLYLPCHVIQVLIKNLG